MDDTEALNVKGIEMQT